MSNQEYHQQKAAEAQHRRDLERAAEKTALAAQRAAMHAEGSRNDLNESLHRQEQIAETNSFRTIVLATLPLVDSNKRSQYLIEQISKRIPFIKNGSLSISDFDLYNCLGILDFVNKSNSKLINSDVFKTHLESMEIIQRLHAKYTRNIDNIELSEPRTLEGEINRKKRNPIVLLMFAIISSIVVAFDLPGAKTSGDTKVLLIIGILILCAILVAILNYLVQGAIDELISLEKKKSGLKDETEKIKQLLIRYCHNSDNYKKLKDSNPEDLVYLFFDSVVSDLISNEQMFIPNDLKVELDEWKISVITKSTIENVTDHIRNFDSKILSFCDITQNGVSINTIFANQKREPKQEEPKQNEKPPFL